MDIVSIVYYKCGGMSDHYKAGHSVLRRIATRVVRGRHGIIGKARLDSEVQDTTREVMKMFGARDLYDMPEIRQLSASSGWLETNKKTYLSCFVFLSNSLYVSLQPFDLLGNISGFAALPTQ